MQQTESIQDAELDIFRIRYFFSQAELTLPIGSPHKLNLDLKPYTEIQPKPGRLVLFPSMMWHSTVTFEDGERLVVAFDVRLTG